MLARSLALLVAALAAGGVSAQSAFAGTVAAAPEITGAGSIVATGDPEVIGCSQAAPVSGATRKACPSWKVAKGAAQASVVIKAVAAPGWELDGWTGCHQEVRPYCEITAPAGDVTKSWTPVARFVDHAAPLVVDPKASPVAGNEGYYTVGWGDSEPGVTYSCSLNGAGYAPCKPGLRLRLPEGPHRLYVYGTDPSGNSGALAAIALPVVDTTLPIAPREGARLRSVEFEAQSRVADRFECSLDGAAFVHCGLGMAGTSTPLSLPNLAEGRHTLRVRGVAFGTVDLFPAERTFTIDTTAPETTIRATDAGFALGSDEADVTYRCRIDTRPYGPCDANVPLAPGAHDVEAFATDEAGNADATPATLKWTVAAPPAGGPTPGNGTPSGNGTPGGGASGNVTPNDDTSGNGAPNDVTVGGGASTRTTSPAPAGGAPRASAPRLAFSLRYRYAKGRLTALKAVGLTKGTKATVTVVCPAKRSCPKSPTTIARLVGKRLAPGTRISVTAGATTRTITLPRSR
jgi:hypothetical protein